MSRDTFLSLFALVLLGSMQISPSAQEQKVYLHAVDGPIYTVQHSHFEQYSILVVPAGIHTLILPDALHSPRRGLWLGIINASPAPIRLVGNGLPINASPGDYVLRMDDESNAVRLMADGHGYQTVVVSQHELR